MNEVNRAWVLTRTRCVLVRFDFGALAISAKPSFREDARCNSLEVRHV